MNAQPNDDLPMITGLSAKIGTAERRIEHLERRITERSPNYEKSTSADFDRAEISMLNAAVKCMRAHQAVVSGQGVLIYRGTGTDLATDIKAMLSPRELERLKDAL